MCLLASFFGNSFSHLLQWLRGHTIFLVLTRSQTLDFNAGTHVHQDVWFTLNWEAHWESLCLMRVVLRIKLKVLYLQDRHLATEIIPGLYIISIFFLIRGKFGWQESYFHISTWEWGEIIYYLIMCIRGNIIGFKSDQFRLC